MPDQPHEGELLIVTGMSGAGRSTVANALEDIGWYVVDNLPPAMIRPLSQMATMAGSNMPRLAVVIDIRGGSQFDTLSEELRVLEQTMTISTRVLFLEATDPVLVRRFEQVRRPHPLQGDGTIIDGIEAERTRLEAVRERADLVIDTSSLNVHELTSKIVDIFAEQGAARLTLTIMSFGFKHGMPIDVDMVADMRFLPNPFWDPDLRAFTGLDAPVRDYVLSQPAAIAFLDNYERALRIVLDGYLRENKHHVTLAVGCTGGKHRSVAMAEELGRRVFDIDGAAVQVKHRDLGKE